ncbi:nucleotidyltransferase family protein [Dyadobacter sp. CY323]|uniref:nucleotidyltransferase family protein n=1 Tax=Dyadobacter sp. CY323 TaxID=2907302 RepID=UPI001F228EDD|nr:nucleotidyltransferase domain-containing protein [Dyadobacter sp. CY323]MCE6988495.1 nucleotidyltransferase domain-containing protein [Dyadobacter sp. CY323]
MVDAAVIGLRESDMTTIHDALKSFPQIKKATLFGSRAKGNYKPGSDIDLALKIDGTDVTNQVGGVLNDDLMLPYKFDVHNIDTINNADLLDHINRVGIPIFGDDQ